MEGLIRAADILVRHIERTLGPIGLTYPQFVILRALPAKQVHISEATGISTSNVSGILDRLEAAGWAKREQGADRRSHTVARVRSIDEAEAAVREALRNVPTEVRGALEAAYTALV